MHRATIMQLQHTVYFMHYVCALFWSIKRYATVLPEIKISSIWSVIIVFLSSFLEKKNHNYEKLVSLSEQICQPNIETYFNFLNTYTENDDKCKLE